MIKRTRIILNITVNESTYKKILYIIEDYKEKFTEKEEKLVDIFLLAEDKKGLKDICIKVTSREIFEAQAVFDKIINFIKQIKIGGGNE